jgi:hypothetical protein
MSTKTTIKRIALVSVAALGFGVLSVVPSTAVTNADLLTVSATTAAQTTAETATATSATATLSYIAGLTTDSMSVTSSLVSAPAGATALPYLQVVETSSAQVQTTVGTSLAAGTGSVGPNVAGFVVPTAATAVSAKVKVYLGQGNATTAPTTVGTYVVKLTPAVTTGGGALNSTAQTITITVTAAATLSTTVDATTSTSILNTGETNTATADATVTGSMTIPAGGNTEAAGTIAVTLKNTAGTTQTGESYTAVIVSGPGLLGSGAAADGTTFAGVGRAIAVQHNHVVGVFPDGTSGAAKIEIRTAAGVVIGTETVTFYGAVASIVATVVKPIIGARAETGVITAVAKDAAGTTIPAPTLYITSSDLTVVNASGAAAASSAAGVVTFGFTGLKAGTANFTVGNAATAATVSAAAVSVRVAGGTAALDGVLVTLDKGSYAPGEAATITVTPTDAAGLVLADDTYTVFTSAGLVASYALPSGSATITSASAQNGGVAGTGTAKGVATYKIYMPSIEGDFKLTWTRSADFATAANDSLAGSVTVAVSSPGVAAATDAANEAIDAANAATDAALAAAEAADAATTAAQEASDAVAALSESVTKLIASLQAQIKSLAAVVAKIAKKVKA